MDSIITHLILYIQYLHKIIYDLILFISKNIPLGQMSFDESNNPKYQKLKVDKLPKIIKFEKVDYQLLLAYYKHKYNKTIKAVSVEMERPYLLKLSAPNVVSLMTIFMITIVVMVNINVKFVVLHLKKITLLLLL